MFNVGEMCPLLSIGMSEYRRCQESRCAWWTGRECAIAAIATWSECQRKRTIEFEKFYSEVLGRLDNGQLST